MPKLNPKFLATIFFWKGELHHSNILKGELHPSNIILHHSNVVNFTPQILLKYYTSLLKCLKVELHPSNIILHHSNITQILYFITQMFEG